MSLSRFEIYDPQERKEAIRNENRKLKLFFQFKDEETRNNALKHFLETREFQDEFNHVIDFGPDTDPSRAHDGLRLRFDVYDTHLMEKIRNYFDTQGFEVVDTHEWIIEPEEQKQEQEKIVQDTVMQNGNHT